MSRGLMLCTSVLLSACVAPQARLQPLPAPTQSSRFEAGVGVIESRMPRSVVVLQPLQSSHTADRRLHMEISIHNTGQHPVDVDPAHIVVRTPGSKAYVVSSTQLLKEIQRAQNWAQFGNALLAGAESYNAQQSAYSNWTGQASSTVHTPGGTARVQTHVSGTSYNPAIAGADQARVNQQAAARADSIAASGSSQMAQVQNWVLQRSTISPQGVLQGWLVLDLGKPVKAQRNIEIRISLGNDVHHMVFSESRLH